jgi:DHA1 family bicyclomycin/chloramphenicol resistance-like MFS transporter
VQGFIQTLGGGLIGALIGQAFDGTTTPLAAGFFGLGLVSLLLVAIAERGRLYQTGSPPVTRE